MENINILYHR